MKAVVVRQPWATLIALGVKTIETRPGPPNGPMRPDGVRGLPGCRLERGERIAIVAGVGIERGFFPIRNVAHLGGPETSRQWRLPNGHLIDQADLPGATFPHGVVVATVVVADALPIIDANSEMPFHAALWIDEFGRLRWLDTARTIGDWIEGRHTRGDQSDQLPLGDFTPGRWGWMLTDPRPCEPIPCKGRQGVFELPNDVAGTIA